MALNNRHLLIFLSAVYIFSSCKKSDPKPAVPVNPVAPQDTVAAVASITSITPTSGPSSTLDTIVGTNFSEKDSVYFNGKTASIVSTTATQLIVKVPPQAGTGKVSITASGKSVSGPVFTFTGNTYLVSTFAGSGVQGFADGMGTAAGFNSPSDIAIDLNDNLYVADAGNNRIRMITANGVVTTVAGNDNSADIEGTGALASFNQPTGIAVYGNDTLYVAETAGNRIRKITPSGTVSTFAGTGSFGTTNGIGTKASFFYPYDITVDGSGNVFVTEQSNQIIRKITPSGTVSTFTGSGPHGSADGPIATASFSGGSVGITFDAAGNLYAADGGNSNIRKITPDGTVTTIAGQAGVTGTADGTGLSATFFNANSIAVDANGFMYVNDQNNEVIRQITPDGAVTLLAGVFGTTGNDNGPALKARFNNPVSVAIDSHGNLFVADANSNTIRKLTPQ